MHIKCFSNAPCYASIEFNSALLELGVLKECQIGEGLAEWLLT